MKVLIVSELTYKIEGKCIFENATFDVSKNEIVGLVGNNGCGKTTIISICLTLITDYLGDVLVLGYNPRKDEQFKRYISYLPENVELLSGIAVEKYLRYSSIFGDFDFSNYDKYINIFDLQDILKLECEKLSKGNTQKIAITAALASNPKLLFMDEPTDGLDEISKQQFIDMLLEFKKVGSGFIVSHDVDFLNEVADRILHIRDCKIVEMKSDE